MRGYLIDRGAALARVFQRPNRHQPRRANPRRGPLRPREGQRAHSRASGGSKARRSHARTGLVPGRSARRRENESGKIHRPRDQSRVRSPIWAASGTKRKSAATGARTSVRFPARSSRRSSARARATRSCSTRSTRCRRISGAIRRPRLEVLDPEQNHTFVITTRPRLRPFQSPLVHGQLASGIAGPLQDRLEYPPLLHRPRETLDRAQHLVPSSSRRTAWPSSKSERIKRTTLRPNN